MSKLKDQIYKILYKNSTVDGVRILHEDVWPIDELAALLQQIEEEAYKKMSNRNVAICSKCNSLFKAKHENCLSLQGEQEENE